MKLKKKTKKIIWLLNGEIKKKKLNKGKRNTILVNIIL
jgi:hypothetical protein